MYEIPNPALRFINCNLMHRSQVYSMYCITANISGGFRVSDPLGPVWRPAQKYGRKITYNYDFGCSRIDLDPLRFRVHCFSKSGDKLQSNGPESGGEIVHRA